MTFSASVSASNYPGPMWVLEAVLRGPSAINLTSTWNGSAHEFNAPTETTQAWKPGAYTVSVRAVSVGGKVELSRDQVHIMPDLASVTGPYDGRTEYQKALDAIEAVLAKRASLDQERYRINNRELWRTPIADLLKLRGFYKRKVREERNGCGRGVFGRPVHVRFK